MSKVSDKREGLDYDKTFASVANIVSVRVILAIACEKGLEQMDVRDLLAPAEAHHTCVQFPDGYSLDNGMSARLLSGLYGTS